MIHNRAKVVFTKEPFIEVIDEIKKLRLHGISIISDRTVAGIYSEKLLHILKKAGIHCYLFTFPPGDKWKTRETKEKIEDSMIKLGVTRKWGIIALGGGVTGDMAGFIASTFMRGIPWFNIPTTLLAITDASIGGKTAVNIPGGKNLIGTFYQPDAVYICSLFLKPLPHKEWLNGTAEIIKHAVCFDPLLFSKLEYIAPISSKTPHSTLETIIRTSIRIKQKIVNKDEKEKSVRSVLNFGHTIGHAIEASSRFSVPHGEAVATGIFIESFLSTKLGLLSREEFFRIENLIKKSGFKLQKKVLMNKKFLSFIQSDKKRVSEETRFVLLERIGKTAKNGKQWTFEIPEKVIKTVIEECISSY